MTALTEARAHLRKAREFLDAARLALDAELFNAATSSAVTSAINAKDAICLSLTGKTAKTENHAAAVAELRGAGAAARPVATTLGRVLKLKNRSQYQADDGARADATKAVDWATTMVDQASVIVPR